GESCEVEFRLARADLAFTRADGTHGAEPGWFDGWVAPSSVAGEPAAFELLAPAERSPHTCRAGSAGATVGGHGLVRAADYMPCGSAPRARARWMARRARDQSRRELPLRPSHSRRIWSSAAANSAAGSR